MILIKEVTAKELAQLWKELLTAYVDAELAAQAVLNSLQVKADVGPKTLPDAAPSSSRSCSANLGASRSSGSEETKV